MNRIENLALDFCKGQYDRRLEDEVWPLVFEYLANNVASLSLDKHSIHSLWTQNGGHLRRKIANDSLLLSVLLKVLPNYDGEGLVLYRGECKFLYEDQKIGFCWTPEKSVARMFARGLNAIESGGVLLQAYAPSHAIISPPNEHSSIQMEEHEYTCNPNLLEDITVIASYEKAHLTNTCCRT